MNTLGSVGRRQHPLHAFEAREIAIEAEDRRAVLDSQRCKMRVRRQIAGGTGGLEQSPEDLGVPLAGVHHLRPRMPEPVLDDAQGIFHRERLRKDAAPGGEAQKSQKRRPCKSDAARIVETPPQGSQRRRMLIARAVDGIEKRIDVRQDHRLRRYRSMSSSSSSSAASEAALVRSRRGLPMSKVRGSKALSRCFTLRSPARIALFSTCLKGSPRRRTSLRNSDSTSGSSVTVVRIVHQDASFAAVMMPPRAELVNAHRNRTSILRMAAYAFGEPAPASLSRLARMP